MATPKKSTKKIKAIVKIQLPGGKATPAPPVGTVLGPRGINLMDFVQKFNAATQDKIGKILPAVISIYEDKTFSFIIKVPPVAYLIKETLGITKGATTPSTQVVGKLTQKQVREIAQTKMVDLNTQDIEAAMRSVVGAAKSMGVAVEG